MAQKTITVKKVITVCDYCGLEVQLHSSEGRAISEGKEYHGNCFIIVTEAKLHPERIKELL